MRHREGAAVGSSLMFCTGQVPDQVRRDTHLSHRRNAGVRNGMQMEDERTRRLSFSVKGTKHREDAHPCFP